MGTFEKASILFPSNLDAIQNVLFVTFIKKAGTILFKLSNKAITTVYRCSLNFLSLVLLT